MYFLFFSTNAETENGGGLINMTTMMAFQEDGPGVLWKMTILVLNKQKVEKFS